MAKKDTKTKSGCLTDLWWYFGRCWCFYLTLKGKSEDWQLIGVVREHCPVRLSGRQMTVYNAMTSKSYSIFELKH